MTFDDELTRLLLPVEQPYESWLKGNRFEKVLREQLSYVQFDEEEYKND